MPLHVYVNQRFTDEQANLLLERRVREMGHVLTWSAAPTTSNLSAAAPEAAMLEAEVVFGQPDPAALLESTKLKWAQLTTAGYERYDRPEIRSALSAKGAVLTNSSAVYEEPCAQHALSMILAQARQLPASLQNQQTTKGWPAASIRRSSRLLVGQTVLLLSFGSIARRLTELLTPLHMEIVAARRTPSGDEPIKIISQDEVNRYLPHADHVVNILPGGTSTNRFMSPERFALMKEGSVFYNIGRGPTVDQDALLAALNHQLAAAWLDVTDPEPLPPNHPLWSHPNCHITPHTAGGHADEFIRIVTHFTTNLDRFEKGLPLLGRVV